MALTNAQVREILSEYGVPAENLKSAADRIIQGHVASIDALRETVDGYKQDAEKLADVQKELDALKLKYQNAEPYQKKFEDMEQQYTNEHKAFESYKTEQANEKVKQVKTSAYRKMLKDAGIADTQIDSILRVSGEKIDSLELDENGIAKNAEAEVSSIKKEWAGFIPVIKSQTSEPPATPPHNTKGAEVTKEQFAKMGYKSRMQIYNDNPDLYAELTN